MINMSPKDTKTRMLESFDKIIAINRDFGELLKNEVKIPSSGGIVKEFETSAGILEQYLKIMENPLEYVKYLVQKQETGDLRDRVIIYLLAQITLLKKQVDKEIENLQSGIKLLNEANNTDNAHDRIDKLEARIKKIEAKKSIL